MITDNEIPMIQAHEIHKSFGDLKVLNGISFNVASGEVVAIIGPSGSGKSTFLRVLNRIYELYPKQTAFGKVLLEGYDLLDVSVDFVWHRETSLSKYDGILIPGGFSYGDYLRCGAIARFSNIMEDIISYEQQALDLLEENHPHYDEIRSLLTDQINDEIKDYANSRTD